MGLKPTNKGKFAPFRGQFTCIIGAEPLLLVNLPTRKVNISLPGEILPLIVNLTLLIGNFLPLLGKITTITGNLTSITGNLPPQGAKITLVTSNSPKYTGALPLYYWWNYH